MSSPNILHRNLDEEIKEPLLGNTRQLYPQKKAQGIHATESTDPRGIFIYDKFIAALFALVGMKRVK
jgi:hypothetical protein